MDSLKTTFGVLWPEGMAPSAPPASASGVGAQPGFRPARTPSETKADETTRVAREMTDAAAEQRIAKTAQLRQARLAKEAEMRAVAAAAPPKAKRRTKSG